MDIYIIIIIGKRLLDLLGKTVTAYIFFVHGDHLVKWKRIIHIHSIIKCFLFSVSGCWRVNGEKKSEKLISSPFFYQRQQQWHFPFAITIFLV